MSLLEIGTYTFYYRRLLKKAFVIPFNDKSLILTFIISDDYHKFHNRDTSGSLMKNKGYWCILYDVSSLSVNEADCIFQPFKNIWEKCTLGKMCQAIF